MTMKSVLFGDSTEKKTDIIFSRQYSQNWKEMIYVSLLKQNGTIL